MQRAVHVYDVVGGEERSHHLVRVGVRLRLRLRLRLRARVRVRVRVRAGHTSLLHQLQALGPPLDHAVERELDWLTCARLGSGVGVGVG